MLRVVVVGVHLRTRGGAPVILTRLKDILEKSNIRQGAYLPRPGHSLFIRAGNIPKLSS